MSDEKTEDPTPTRLRKLREKGDLPRSADLCCAAVFVTLLALTAALSGSFAADLSQIWSMSVGSLAEAGLNAQPSQLVDVAASASRILMKALLVPLAALMLVAAVSTFLQVGPVVALQPLIPDLERLSPAKNLAQLFSPRNLWEVLRALIKVGLGAATCYVIIRNDLQLLLRLSISDVRGVAIVAGSMIWDLSMALAVISVLVGAFDVFHQRNSWLKRNRMSKDEVKREYKQNEGDPEIKHARKQAYEELTTEEMCDATRTEGMVLVRNPNHIAVVLKYVPREKVPKVVACGTGEVARRIIAEARKRDLPEQHDRSLARELLKVKPRGMVPRPLWETVGEVLAWAADEYIRSGRAVPWDETSADE